MSGRSAARPGLLLVLGWRDAVLQSVLEKAIPPSERELLGFLRRHAMPYRWILMNINKY